MELTKAFYSPTDVAEMLSVESATIMNWIHAEKLFAIKLSERTYRIPQRALALFLGHPVKEPTIVEYPDDDTLVEEILQRHSAEHRVPVTR